MFYKKSMLIGIVCVLTACAVAQGEYAESVFAIASHDNSRTKAYRIDGDHIDYQATIDETEKFADGACGLCVWPAFEKMFTTYEGSGIIAWASTKTLDRDQDEDEFNTGITGTNGLAGIIADEYQSVLYIITRSGGKLYTYFYDEEENTLILAHPDAPGNQGPDYRQLEGLENGYTYGLAIDDQGTTYMGETAGLLYVANGTSSVRCYNTFSWELVDTIDMGRQAAGIGLDIAAGHLYAGYFNGTSGFHHYLIRRDLNGDPGDPETLIEKDLEAVIMDISADPNTGLIYTTTDRSVDGSAGTVEVYDPTNWISTDPCTLVLLDTEYDGDFVSQGPAGIAIGPRYKPPDMVISKVDDIGDCDPNSDPCCVLCVVPDDFITYTICYYPGFEDEYNVAVIDYLPWGVDFISADPCNNGYYTDRPAHTYTWEIGFLPGRDPCDPSDPNQCLELTVQVNEWADPLGELLNIAEIESDTSYNKVKEYTPVCCWTYGIIYVDKSATGAETGVDWENAYTDLQSALRRAGECGCEVWVARGTYSPGGDATDSFEISDGVEVYGGFKGVETSREQRDFTRYETILTGKLINETVVTMGDETVLDGFVVEKGDWRGVYGDSSDFTVRNCSIIGIYDYGIYSEDGDVTVSWCIIKENGLDGIRHRYGGFSLRVENCKVYKNGQNGIYCRNSFPTIINSMIYENGLDGNDYYGIDLYQPSISPDIRNNTIVHNENEGIKFSGDNTPDIHNCILWHNNSDNGFEQLDNCSAEYSCITDPNDPYGLLPGASTPDQHSNNITCDPCFAYSYPKYGYYHLDPDSHCVDAGDNSVVDPNNIGEYDIDGDDRIINGGGGLIVDMGADEVACEDVSHPYDFTGDGIINLHEFADLSRAWLLDNTDPNWADTYVKCDFYADDQIDILDLRAFADEWLWQACWRLSAQGTWLCSSSGGGDSSRMITDQSSPALTTPSALKRRRPPTYRERIDQLEELIYWVKDLWLDPEIRKEFDEKEWMEFTDKLWKEWEKLVDKWSELNNDQSRL